MVPNPIRIKFMVAMADKVSNDHFQFAFRILIKKYVM